MKTRILFLFVLLFLLTSACFREEEEFNRELIIPEKEFTQLLTDLYLADGLLFISDIRQKYSRRDSFANYEDVMEKHQVTRKEMDETFRYYTYTNRQELEEIYDRVFERLTRLETENLQEIRGEKPEEEPVPEEFGAGEGGSEEKKNLWTGKKIYRLPEDGKHETGWQKIPVRGPGTYTLSADIRVFPDDESKNPKITACFYYDDGSDIGKRDTYVSTDLIKDGVSRTYTVTKELTDQEYTHIIVWILNHYYQEREWSKHAIATNIRLTYTPSGKEEKK